MKEIEELRNVMRRLRAPDGCPWDRKQTHQSLLECLMGEAAEFMDAADEKNDIGMREELGDLLMQIVLHSVIAEERNAFTLEDVTRDITQKMIRRHEHVFGDAKADTAEDVVKLWEKVKAKEPDHVHKSLMDGIPNHCPALFQAEKMQKKAAKAGFDWNDRKQILEKIREELDELEKADSSMDANAVSEEAGDLLFSVVNYIRFIKGPSAEETMARANAKFSRRFRYIENELEKRGISVSDAPVEEMEKLWNEAKTKEVN